VVKEAKNLEGGIDAENLKLKKWEKRLNDIRNQREYLALNREVEAYRSGQKREAEERITRAHQTPQRARAKLADIKTRQTEIEEKREAETVRVNAELARASSSRR